MSHTHIYRYGGKYCIGMDGRTCNMPVSRNICVTHTHKQGHLSSDHIFILLSSMSATVMIVQSNDTEAEIKVLNCKELFSKKPFVFS